METHDEIVDGELFVFCYFFVFVSFLLDEAKKFHVSKFEIKFVNDFGIWRFAFTKSFKIFLQEIFEPLKEA